MTNLTTFQSINLQINNLKDYATGEDYRVLIELHNHFNDLLSAEYSTVEATDLLKGSGDCLANLSQDHYFYADVRNIQDQMIGFFTAINHDYMNIETGEVQDFDGWFYEDENGVQRNAVLQCEVVRVEKDIYGGWILV